MAREDFWGELIGDGLLLVISVAFCLLLMFLLHLAGVSTPMPQTLIGASLGSFVGMMLEKHVHKRSSGDAE